jgi:hypothetical protein
VGPTSTTTSTFNKSSPQTEDSQALPNKGWRKVEEGEGEGKGKGKGERVGQVSSCQCLLPALFLVSPSSHSLWGGYLPN